MSSDIEDEGAKAIRVSKISALANIVLAILKGFAGVAVNSTALIADSLHSLIDVLASVFVWIGIKISAKPPDKTHPYGHFKAESLAELLVGAVIILTSFWIMYEAIFELVNRNHPNFEIYAVAVAFLSMAVNEWMARYKIKTGIETRSSSLVAEGKHSRVDVISSFAVVLGFIFVYFGYWWADGVIAIVISVLILQMGGGILKNAVDVLMDKVDEGLALMVKRVVESVEGVESVEKIVTRGTWRGKIVEVHFRVMRGMSAETINAVENEIVEIIKSLGVASVIPVVKIAESHVVAIPVNEKGEYAEDFDSPFYLIVDLKSRKIEKVENPHHRAEKRKGYLIAEFLSKHNVGSVICSEIGEGAKAHLRGRGISVRMNGGEVDKILKKLKG